MSIPSPVIIDISEHQKPSAINYDQLAKAVDAVIIRVQYGSNYEDIHYKTHIAEFKKRGIPFGVYAWVRGVSKSDMEQEATDFYNRAKAYNPAFWWLDVEEQSMGDMRGGCEAYRVKLRNLGAPKVGVYVANHLFEDFNLNTDFFDGLWVPTYSLNDNGTYQGNNPTATNKYNIHQYSSNGRRDGYNGPLDMNRLVSNTFAHFFGGVEETVAKKEKAIVYKEKPYHNVRVYWFAAKDDPGLAKLKRYCKARNLKNYETKGKDGRIMLEIKYFVQWSDAKRWLVKFVEDSNWNYDVQIKQ